MLPRCLPAGNPPRLMAVPTHFYKVVLADNSSGKKGAAQTAVGAFVMPNAPIDPKTPLSAFVVPLEGLEDVVGGCCRGHCCGSMHLRCSLPCCSAW